MANRAARSEIHWSTGDDDVSITNGIKSADCFTATQQLFGRRMITPAIPSGSRETRAQRSRSEFEGPFEAFPPPQEIRDRIEPSSKVNEALGLNLSRKLLKNSGQLEGITESMVVETDV